MPTLSAQQIRPHFLKVAGFHRLRIQKTRFRKTQHVVAVAIGVALYFREDDIRRIQREKAKSFPGLVELSRGQGNTTG